MGRQFDKGQIDALQSARVGVLNFSASGASNNATAAITSALTTAGDEGVSVPLQVSSSITPGVITTGIINRCLIVNNANLERIADASGNEVYGRITEAGNVYTMTYFSLVAGVETAYTFASATAINFYFAYCFDFARYPRNAAIAMSATLFKDDPSVVSGSSMSAPSLISITATNTLAALPTAPSAAGRIMMFINGKAEFATGANAAYTVSGTTVTWSAANAKYSLLTTMEAYALVW